MIDVDEYPFVQLLEAAWSAGVVTWEPRDWPRYWWPWITILCQVANARSNGWRVPLPW